MEKIDISLSLKQRNVKGRRPNTPTTCPLWCFFPISPSFAFKAVGGKCLCLFVLITQRPLRDVRVAHRPSCGTRCGGQGGRNQDHWLWAQPCFRLRVTQKLGKDNHQVLPALTFSGWLALIEMTGTSYNITIQEFGCWCGGGTLLSYKKTLFEWPMPPKLNNGLKLGLFPNSNESNIWMEACNPLLGWKELCLIS